MSSEEKRRKYMKKYNKEYQYKNREKIKKYKREYNIKNKEKQKEHSKVYRQKNKVKINKRDRVRYLKRKVAVEEYNRKYRINNKEKLKEQYLKKNYGIDYIQHDYVLKQQDSKCAICNIKFNNQIKSLKPHVDHDHKTGAFRGLLCNRCNIELGHYEKFKNNPKKVTKIEKYLMKTKNNRRNKCQ